MSISFREVVAQAKDLHFFGALLGGAQPAQVIELPPLRGPAVEQGIAQRGEVSREMNFANESHDDWDLFCGGPEGGGLVYTFKCPGVPGRRSRELLKRRFSISRVTSDASKQVIGRSRWLQHSTARSTHFSMPELYGDFLQGLEPVSR